MNDKLSAKEKIEISVQTGLQIVPYVGPALSTAYFSTKQEKRLKRIESFYSELATHIKEQNIQLPPLKEHDEECLTSLIENLNEYIESEHSRKKRAYFKNFFINSLQQPTIVENYDERKIFLEVLASMTILEFEVLLSFSEEYKHLVEELDFENRIIPIAKSRLETSGLLDASYTSETFPGSSSIHKDLKITNIGENFIKFCLA
ncbi:hypothetical protein [Salibacterium sp. K-3]